MKEPEELSYPKKIFHWASLASLSLWVPSLSPERLWTLTNYMCH